MVDRRPRIEIELRRLLADVAGLAPEELQPDVGLVEQGLDSLSLTQATLELERVFGVKLRFRRLMEDLDTLERLTVFFDAELPAERFAPPVAPSPSPEAPSRPAPAVAMVAAPAAVLTAAVAPANAPGEEIVTLIRQQMALMQQQLALLAGATSSSMATLAATGAAVALPPVPSVSAAAADDRPDLVARPFGASARITVAPTQAMSAQQRAWLDRFTADYLARTGGSREFSQRHRARMADPRVVTGFNPLWKDLVYPIVADRSEGARIRDIDGNEYIDLLSCFGANLLGYSPKPLVEAMRAQLDLGLEVGPQHPLAAEVAELIAEFTGHERVGFCNTGSEAVMGAMRIARTVTGRKTIAIFTNSYHGIFDEVIVRGSRQLRSLAAAPGILANAVENVLVLDYASEASLKVLRERGPELAAIMIEPVQNKYPTLQPRAFVHALRDICDQHGCALIFDEVVTGFRLAPGGAQEFYDVRADLCTYGKVIGGGLPFAAIAGAARWLDALDGGHWRYGDDSYPEAGVTYFAGTFVRHPLALAAARASLLELKRAGPGFYHDLNARTRSLVERLNAAFATRRAPVEAVHCASLWRLAWDEEQKYVSLFYYLARHHGLHLFEQFGHFVTAAMGAAELDRIVEVFVAALDELMAQGFILPRPASSEAAPGSESSESESEPEPEHVSGPLSPGQGERWLAASYDEHALRALDETFSLDLSGEVDRAALESALREVCARHPAFRLRLDEETPSQTLDESCPPRLEIVELGGEPDPEQALRAGLAAAGQQRFALGRAPMAALHLFWLGRDRAVLHLIASHLVFDGWATSVFLSELARLYHGYRRGERATLPPAESPIAFAQEMCRRMAGPEGQAALAFWCRTLRDPPPALSLGDRQPGSRRSFAADTSQHRYGGDLLAGLRRAARVHHCTLFQLLLAATVTALRRLSGQSDFVLSLPYAGQALGRHPALLADGVFDLPIRLRVVAGQSPLDLLPAVRPTLMDALEHPIVTQGAVARALGLPARGDRPPLTGVFFNLNPRVDLSGFAPLTATMREGRKPGLLGELIFNFYDEPEALALDLHHSSEFFGPTRIAEVADALETALREAAGSPPEPERSKAVSAPVVAARSPAGAVAAALVPVASTPVSTPLPCDVLSMIRPHVETRPGRTALRFAGHGRSYGALGARVEAIAEALRAAGVEPGARVGLYLGRGLDLPAAMLATFAVGAAYVPLDPAFPRGRLRHMVEDAGLEVLLYDQSALPEELSDGRLALALDAIPDRPRGRFRPCPPDGEAVAYVLYTSGSTGKPKGVAVRQRNVASFLAAMQRRPGIVAEDRMLATTTPSFDISVLELLLPLTVGASVVIASEDEAKNPALIWPLLREEGCTMLQTTPSVMQMWLSDGSVEDLAGRTVLLGGEGLPSALAARLLPRVRALWNMYGPTETTVWSSCWAVESPERGIAIGEPLPGTDFYLLDGDLRPVPAGAEGELCIGGLGVAAGYLNRPELSAERFVALPGVVGPVYRTGDLAVFDAEGRLRHLGRMDAQVKLRGYRIELGEIESVLIEQPEVEQAVVLVREDRPGDQRLVAYLVLAPSAVLDERELRRRLRHGLPDYMLPQHLLTLSALPLLPNGKTDRAALPAPPSAMAAMAASAASVPESVPEDALERSVAEAMAEALGLPGMAVEEGFFRSGGHSLLAIQLSVRLNRAHGCRLKMRDVFEAPTPRALAARVRGQGEASGGEEDAGIVRLTDRGRAPASLMQRRLYALTELDPAGSRFNMPSAHRLRGPLDPARLERALSTLIERQSSLRTELVAEAGGLWQRIVEKVDFRLGAAVDLGDLPEAEALERARADIGRMLAEPIPLAPAPLLRARLYRIGADDHILFLKLHHAIWDGWSFDIFYREMAALYPDPRPDALPVPAVSYGDFAAWHNAWLKSPAYRRQVEYWRVRLDDFGPIRALPADPSSGPAGSGHLSFDLDPGAVARLHVRARALGVTPFLLLLTAYAATLHKVGGERTLLIGTPVRGRQRPELEEVIGFFVSMQPVPVRVPEGGGRAALLAAVRDSFVEGAAHADVQLEELSGLVKTLDGGRGMICQASLSYQDVRGRPTRWGPLQQERFKTGSPSAIEDLAAFFVEGDWGMLAILSYDRSRFSETAAARYLAALREELDRWIAPESELDGDGGAVVAVDDRPGAIEFGAIADTDVEAGFAAAPDTVDHEALLARVWSELLGVARIEPEDNFFELGGHSLLALSMLNRVESATGKRLSLLRVGNGSLRALARELSEGVVGADSLAPVSLSRRVGGWLRRVIGR